MDITPYVERLRSDLVQTAAGGDEGLRAAADRLSTALDPAMRLALMEVLADAAAEITSAMRAGAVEARLRSREIEFVVSNPVPSGLPSAAAPADEPDEADDEGAVARITLRIPEAIKARAEELAAKGGHSLNTWVVNALRRATREDAPIDIDIDLSSIPFLDSLGDRDFPFGRKGSRRMTGWV